MTTTIQPIDRDEWRRLAPTFLDYNYRQLWDFGVACANSVGAQSEHVAIWEGDHLIGLADVRIKKIPIFRTGIAYINGGPLVRIDNDTNAERLKLCLSILINEYVHRRNLVLRVLAPISPPTWNDIQPLIFSEMGFAPSGFGRYRTFLLCIDKPSEQIRKNLAQKWRNCLNSAEKEAFTIRSDTSSELFAEFCELYKHLIKRKEFNVDLDASFYSQVHNHLINGERFHISLVDIQGKLAAGHIFSILGDTCVYLLGASNQEGLRSKASYLLQWHIIQKAIKQSCRWYDLGGIDPQGNPGVYHFKKGLGGIDIVTPGPFELSPSKFKGYLVNKGECLYRTVRRMFHSRY